MTSTTTAALQGHVEERLGPLLAELERALAADPDLSFQVAALHRGRTVLDAWGGPHLGEDSVIVPYSVTKNTIGLVVGLLVQRGELDLDRAVAGYWPEFAAKGKEAVTVRQLLSHQAGLPQSETPASAADLLDHHRAAELLAASRPLWAPGSGFGYHALTIGNLADELVFRVTGRTLHEVYEQEIRSPLGIDFFLGLPEQHEPRLAPVLPVLGAPVGGAAPDPTSWLSHVMGVPGPAIDLANDPRSYRYGHPAASGAGSARGLARLLAATVTGLEGAEPLLDAETVRVIGQQQVRGYDQVLGQDSRAHAIVFQKPTAAMPFGGPWSFGHDGARGALAVADPSVGLAFAYTVSRGPWPGGAVGADALRRAPERIRTDRSPFTERLLRARHATTRPREAGGMRILRSPRALAITALLGATTLAGCAAAPSAAPEPAASGAGADAAVDPAVQEALDALLDAGATAAVIDVRDGERRSAAAGGVRGLDDATAAAPEDRLRIASITKSITATVVLQLVDEGGLELDAEVDALLPGLLDSPGPVTVRQLLQHRSGLPEYLDVLVPDAAALPGHADEVYTPQQLLEAAQTKPWVAEPGEQFSYSNGNYVALGLIAEEVGGAPLPQLMEQRVLDPLGMDDTEYPVDAELPEGALRGDVEIAGEQVDASRTPPSLWSSGAALISSVGDVATFFQALLGGELVSDESLAAMQEIGVEGYGLGLLAGGDACGAQPPELVFGQRGNGFGYRVMAFGSPDGERMTTVAWTGGAFDPATDPLVQPGNDLLIAGLAATCPTG